MFNLTSHLKTKDGTSFEYKVQFFKYAVTITCHQWFGITIIIRITPNNNKEKHVKDFIYLYSIKSMLSNEIINEPLIRDH